MEEDGLSSDIIKKHYRVDHLMRLDFSNSTGVHLKYVKHQKLDQMGRGIPIDQYVTRTGTQYWLHFDMTPGNFTGFGGGQILCSRLKWTGTFSNYNLRTTITGPASYNNKSSITQIIDGLGKKRLISYRPQSVNFLEERKQMLGEAERTSKVFPVAIYKAPLNVVTEIQHESSENQYVSTSYFYGQGRVHKHGKGFLGFDFILKKDLASRTATQETYVVNSQNFQVSLNNRQEWVSLSDVYKLFKNTDYTYKYVTTDLLNNKAYFPYLSNLENHFYEKEGSNTTIERKEIINYSNLDDYGNPQTIHRKYLNKNNVLVSSEVKEVGYDNFVSANRRLLGLLKDEVTTYKMAGEEDVIRRTNYTNNSTTGFREIQIIEPTDEKELTISFTPDAFGNVGQVTQTANGNTPRINTIEYSADGRFPEIETNAEGHIVENQFDPITGLLIVITDENSLSTQFTYNAFRKLLITTKHDGTQIRNNYGWLRGNGSPNQHPDTPEHGDPVYFIRTRASASPEEITFYDQHSRPVRKVEHGFNNEAIYTDFKYFNIEGKNGLLKSKTVPYFAVDGQSAAFESTFDYDFNRRQIIMMNPDGSSETIVYSPNKVSKTNFDGQVQVKEFKANGYLDKVTDNSNAYVSFSYYADGKVRATKINDQQLTEISYTYDTHRRKTTMSDPSLGSVVYNFDAFGDLRMENTNGKKTSFDYDRLGRMNKRTVDEGISIWYWDTEDNGIGKLGSINYQPLKAPFIGFDEAFTYDEDGLILTHTVSVDGQPKVFNYTYDELNRLKTKTWPTGFKTINYYDEFSFLRYITDDNGTRLWEVGTYNQWQNISQFKTGNQVQHNYTYSDINGRLESIKAAHQQHGTLQEFAYNWNPLTANLDERTDVLRNITETFGYDSFNRLTDITQSNNITGWATYNHLGRIESKHDAGTYQYLPNRPYAVDNINGLHSDFPEDIQDIEYTSFNKVKYISEADNELNMAYGPYSQRIWQQNTNADNNSRRQKYYYTPEYEIETNTENQEIHRHYLLGPTGVFAIFTAMNDDEQMHYVLKDHQGSLMGLTDADGMLTESYSYDAFGRRRNAQNWSYDNITTSNITDRGYTFHEHLDEFGLINMNGRVYDPLVGQMLSPDPFIQQPEYSQSYNLYGYVFNNPLRFTDPSGYFAQGDSTGISNRPLMQLHLPLNEDAIPYITNTDIALSGPDVFSLKIEKAEYTQGSTRAGETMSQTLLLSARASRIPPLAMIILGTGSVMTSYYYLKENYAGEGFENYPGPLSYTYEHPSQNPIHQNQGNRGGGGDGKWHHWFVGGAFSVGIIYYYLKSENMKTQEINESLNGKNDHSIQKNDHYINNIQHIQLKEDYYKYRKK